MLMKAQTAQKIVDHCNERARMKRAAEQKEALLARRLENGRKSKDISTYRGVCDQVFNGMGVKLPAIVASRQAQLCQNVHLMTIAENQNELMRKHKRTEFVKLEEDLNMLQQEQCMNESSLLRDILKLEQKIKHLEHQLEQCPLLTETADETRFIFSTRKNTSGSDRTLDTVSSDVSLDGSDVVELVPSIVRSPRLSAPSRPTSLVRV